MQNITEQIRKSYQELTTSQKTVAKFVIDQPKTLALHSAQKIGALTETSETTVIRFCYALGYSGYSALQTEIRVSLLNSDEREGPLKNYRDTTGELISENNLIQRVMEQDVAFIKQTLSSINNELFTKAVDLILQARKIVVVGFRTSYALANWTSFTLNLIRGDTSLYRGPIDDADSIIMEMDEHWLVIAFSFPRYAAETISFVQAAKTKGVKVLGISDDELSPIGIEANVLLKAITPQPSALNGMATIFSLLKALTTGVAAADWPKVQDRVRTYDGQSGFEFHIPTTGS
ncbi:MurR/RpiR family transcriptional regulator [Desulfosporosinus burensis]